MQANLIQIGTSQGVRLPKKTLESIGNPKSFELSVLKDGLFLKPIVAVPRNGWGEAFEKMAKNGDDELLMDDALDIGSFGE